MRQTKPRRSKPHKNPPTLYGSRRLKRVVVATGLFSTPVVTWVNRGKAYPYASKKRGGSGKVATKLVMNPRDIVAQA